MRTFTIISFISIAAFGCSEAPRPPANPGAEPAPVELSALETELAKEACAQTFRCSSDDPNDGSSRLNYANESRCIEHLTYFERTFMADLIQAIEAGVIEFDGAELRRCLTRYRSSCFGWESYVRTPGGLVDRCREAFRGSVAIGGECFRDEDCVPEGFCVKSEGSLYGCPGACRNRAAIGELCYTNLDGCLRTNVNHETQCRARFLPSGEIERRCVEYIPALQSSGVGEPCGPVARDDTSRTFHWCEAGLSCDSSTSTCRSLIPLGEQCTTPEGLPLPCERSFCSDRGVCEGGTVQHALGDPCGDFMPCNTFENLGCGLERTCRSIGTGAAGSACGAGRCEDGLACYGNGINGYQCQTPKAAGASCISSDECLSESCVSADSTGQMSACVARACRAHSLR
jgi:hypothetical protein